ncbi:MAG TPA: GerMN domain-containing protein [Trueperaceae bacterium]|nr:GerMN domain-containing protein [Trueperaceae bacterium]
MRTVVLRVVALALLLLLALVGVITARTLSRMPDTLVYLTRDTGRTFTLEAVPRVARSGGLEDRVRAQVAALTAGPTPEEERDGLGTTVPEGTRVLGVRLDDGVLTVDLSREFTAGGGTASMVGRLNQLYYTLTQPADVAAVSVTVEGRPLTVLGGEGIIVDPVWVRAEHPEVPSW